MLMLILILATTLLGISSWQFSIYNILHKVGGNIKQDASDDLIRASTKMNNSSHPDIYVNTRMSIWATMVGISAFTVLVCGSILLKKKHKSKSKK